MLDHNHGVTRFDEPIQNVEEPLHIGKMQTGRRFVQDVHSPTSRPFGKFARELHPLRFPAGQCRRRLAELHIV